MAVSCIVSEILPDIGRKLRFFHTPFHSTPLYGGSHRNVAIMFGAAKVVQVLDGEKV